MSQHNNDITHGLSQGQYISGQAGYLGQLGNGYFFFFLVFIRVYLIYNVVLLSGVQQNESVKHTHMCSVA